METYTGKYEIVNKLGLHARPASLFVRKAVQYDCEITVSKDSEPETKLNAKSLINILMLVAAKGTQIIIHAEGPDAKKAVEDLGELVKNGFDEEE